MESTHLQDGFYYSILANESGISGAVISYGLTGESPDRIREILETHAELEEIPVVELSIGDVHDAFTYVTAGTLSSAGRQRMIDMGKEA
jgi:hypothetical protein